MKWSPSLRTKVVFFCIASLVLLGFCLTLATLYAVERRKHQIVEQARQLAQSRAEQLSKRLEQLFEEEKAGDLPSLLKSKRFEQAVRLVISDRRDGRPLLCLIYGKDGKLQYRVAPEIGKNIKVDVAVLDKAELASGHHAIVHGGQPKGEVVVTYAPGVLLGEIQAESRRITLWLASLAAALTVILATTFVLLWRAFKRHLERERMHEQLDRMAYVGTLASGLAHEIRNPLNALSLNLDIIGEELADPQTDSLGRAREVVGLLKSEVARLNSTLTNFLQFALPARRKMQMTDIVAILHETAALLEPDMRRLHIAYRYEGERSCVSLADPTALRQVFWNVLLNAIQAVEDREERRIEAHCRVEDGRCEIEIRDTGPGVPLDQRENVFEVFHSTKRGGSGFGLAIARQIVQRHNGRIWIDSVDGWGCVVHICLPMVVS